MKNLNLTLSLTEAGKCATKLAQGIDGPVYAMKMQNGKYICGLSFIIAIAGRSAFGDEFDTNATYEILVRLTELNTGHRLVRHDIQSEGLYCPLERWYNILLF